MIPNFKPKHLIIGTLIFLSVGLFFANSASASTIKVVLSNLGLVGYWPMNESSGTLSRDYSGNGNNGTLTGGSAWAAGQKEGAISLDGSGDYVLVSDSNSLDVTTNITISAWVNPVSASNNGIVMKGNALGNSQGVYSLIVANSVVRMRFGTDEPSAVLASTALTNNVWTHVVATYDGTTARIYLNGVLNNSNAHTGAISADANPLYIGQYYNTPYSFNGKLDDVRIYSRALSASEVLRLYRGEGAKFGVTQSTNSLATGLVGHWSFDGNKTTWTSSTAGTATDSSGNSNTGTLTNMNQATAPTDGVIGQALNFDGVNDYVITTGSYSASANAPIAVSAWVNTQSLTNPGGYARRIILLGGSSQPFSLVLNNGALTIYANNGVTLITDGVTVSTNRWYHIVGVYNGTSFSLYVNGVLVAGPTVASLNSILASFVYLGTYDNGGGKWQGSIDDVRIYSRALSTAEIKRLYNMGRPSVVTSGDHAFPNVVLSLHMNGADGSTTFTDSSSSAKTVPATGNAQIDTAQSKWGGASGLFDGTGDYIAPASSIDYAFGTGDFTAEWWVRSTDGTANWIGLTGAGALSGAWMSVVVSNTIYWQTAYGLTNLYSRDATAILDGNWHHVAISRSGTSHRLFFDGVQQGATVTDSTDYNVTSIMAIGTGVNGDFNGWFDDIRITKGVARYTSNFTPPTREFYDNN